MTQKSPAEKKQANKYRMRKINKKKEEKKMHRIKTKTKSCLNICIFTQCVRLCMCCDFPIRNP